MLGKRQQWVPKTGTHITVDLANADVEQWQPLLNDIINLTQSDSSAAQASLFDIKKINGRVEQVSAYGEDIHQLSFEVTPEMNWWSVDVSAKEIRGKAKIFSDWLGQGLEVNLDFLHLLAKPQHTVNTGKNNVDALATKLKPTKLKPTKLKPITLKPTTQAKAQTEATAIDLVANRKLFDQLPPIKVYCESCQYKGYNLGKVSFSIDKENEDTLKLKRFSAQRDKMKIIFDGFWQFNQQKSTTKITGIYSTNSVEREIESVGYTSIFRDSGAEITYDIDWQGAPHDFAISRLNGKISAELDDGYLEDVDDQGVRIFSILSLQSLVRKLSFDFRDIFSDGMFYSKFSGDFIIKNGVAYTDNLFMKGSAGDLSIKGNTDVVHDTLDYRMLYKPNLTSSLPVLAWLATTNPVSVLAAMALDEVLDASVVSEIDFEVTGAIDDPSIKQVSQKNKNISVGRSTPPKIIEVDKASTPDNSKVAKPEKKK